MFYKEAWVVTLSKYSPQDQRSKISGLDISSLAGKGLSDKKREKKKVLEASCA